MLVFPSGWLDCRDSGTVNVFPEVKQLVLFAALHDIDIELIWESRESDALLHADILSRVEDSSELSCQSQHSGTSACYLVTVCGGAFPRYMFLLVVLRTSTLWLDFIHSTSHQRHLQPVLCFRIGPRMHAAMVVVVCCGVSNFSSDRSSYQQAFS